MAEFPPLIVIAGPTASGKSDLGLELSEWIGGEVVNCDSVQLYRYMDIGTGKTPVSERRGIPHHLIDILNPDQVFTAGEYQRVAREALREIAARGRVPVVVGGTGFYLRALLEGLFEGPRRDESLRERLTRRSPERLFKLLKRFDPNAALSIHENDIKKVIRAIEVRLLTRAPISSLYQHNRRALEGFDIVKIVLSPLREALAGRINRRVLQMFERGLVEETRSILARGFPRASKALESIGYRESLLHLEGSIDRDEAISLTQAATRQYAKRQRTWFRRETNAHWIEAFGSDPSTVETAKRLVQKAKNLSV